ncbi:MAG: succinate dehydrogenase, cytochrome b556 subunit [Gammaproteobacteria bacterium]|nr:succinate dehydrogenase, cytochrome b556 subunit [Gammaproteobacteria bacterium]
MPRESKFLIGKVIEKDKRPVNLNLLTTNLPIIGVSSILHRVSGLAVFICFPLVVWLLSISLESEERFTNLQNSFQELILFKLIIFFLFVGFVYHLLAGVKKLLVETLGLGETIKSGNLLTWLIFSLTFVVSIIVLIDIFNLYEYLVL